MKYLKFTIENFKGINNLILRLDGKDSSKVLTLVGLNESGKTTILEALDSLIEPYNDDYVHQLIPKSKKLNFNDTVSISAEIELEYEDSKEIYQFLNTLGYKKIDDIFSISVRRYYKFKTSEFVDDESGFEIISEISAIKRNQSKLKRIDEEDKLKLAEFVLDRLPPIIYYQDFLFDFPERIYLQEGEVVDPETQLEYRNVFTDILYTIDPNLNLEEHIVKRIHSSNKGTKDALEATLDKVSDRITKYVFGAWETLFEGKGKQILIKHGVDNKNLAYIELKVKENSNQYQISERSLGFKWFFSFLLFTEFRKNRPSKNGEVLFLLDEPAYNLHSTAQKKTLEYI